MIGKILTKIGIILLIAIGFCLALFLIGYIIDLFCNPTLKSMANQAQDDIASLQQEVKENAWDDYLLAMEKVTQTTIGFGVDNYIQGKDVLSPQLLQGIDKYPDVYPLIVRGNEKPACRIPFDYEAGWEMPIPNYISVQKIAKILAVQSMQALKSNDQEKSAEIAIQGLKFCNQVIHGGPVLINYMVGIVCYGIMLKHLAYGIEQGKYNASQLDRIRTQLTYGLDSLPLFTWALNGENIVIKSGKIKFNSLNIRLSCWSHFFSPKLALLNGLKTKEKSDAELLRHERASMDITNSDTQAGYLFLQDTLPEKEVSNNPIRALTEVKFNTMLVRKIELTAKLRAMNLAAEIREKESLGGGLPKTLEGLDHENRINPMTGKEWDYTYTADSVVIAGSQPGPRQARQVVYLVLK